MQEIQPTAQTQSPCWARAAGEPRLPFLLAANGQQVRVYGRAVPPLIGELRIRRENREYLPGFALADSITPVSPVLPTR